jgi:RNA recognition motif-containing protein
MPLLILIREPPATFWRAFELFSHPLPTKPRKFLITKFRRIMSKKIYVGNLSYQTTETDLTSLFEQAGQVDSVSIITDRDTGRSKGFAFVEMGNEDADKAIAQFNGAEVNGRALTVNEARPREDRSGGGGRGGYGGNRGGGGGGRGRGGFGGGSRY